MSIVIPAGYCQTSLFFQSSAIDGGNAVVTHGWKLNANTLNSWTENLGQLIDANMVPMLHDGYSFIGVRGITATTDDNWPGLGQGERSGSASPPNIALLERKQTALRGRQHRGRAYWPGFLLDGDVDDSGGIVASHWTEMTNRLTSVYEGAAFIDVQGVILHNDGAVAPTPLTSTTFDTKVASQRRRLRR